MKANEFVKKFGWEESKKHLLEVREAVNQIPYKHSAEDFSNDLKRLVESHDLVGRNDGIESAKMMIERTKFPLSDRIIRLKKAIADVESCMEGL